MFHLIFPSSRADYTNSFNSLSLCPFCLSIFSGHLKSTQCPYRTDVFASRPTLVCPSVRVQRRTTVISSMWFLQQWPACLARVTWMVCERGASGHTAAVLEDSPAKIISKQRVASMCGSHQAFSLKWRKCCHTIVHTRLQLGRNCLILS